MRTAATGLLLGVSDPLALLDTDPEDRLTLVAILNRANEMRTEMRRSEIEAAAVLTANKILVGLGRMFGR